MVSIGIPVLAFLWDIGMILLLQSKNGDYSCFQNKGLLVILAAIMCEILGCRRMSSIVGLLYGF